MQTFTPSSIKQQDRRSAAYPVQLHKEGEGAYLADNRAQSIQRKANNTGLPDNLKSGIENLSGHSLDDVKVHYNSSAPAQLNAHAYAQGNQIHVAPGQEKHVPHEAWHVVQQKQGRVKPTMQMKGKVNVNDDRGLEKEADVMGAKALSMQNPGAVQRVAQNDGVNNSASRHTHTRVVQRQIQLTDADAGIYEEMEDGKSIATNTELVFCSKYYNKKPVFVLKSALDPIESEVEVLEQGDGSKYEREQKAKNAVILAAFKTRFYTEEGDITGQITHKAHYVEEALRHPLIKDPNKHGGLQHRFPAADGVLFSRLPKDDVEQELGTIPPSVQFYEVLEKDWVAEVIKNKAFWTEITANYAYGRHMNKRGIVPRGDRSKFRVGNLSTTDHSDFNNEDHTDRLPPVGPAHQDSGWQDYTAYVNRKDRGKGQFIAMGKWNALAYAAYWYHHGHADKIHLGQDWEWLHIQGAQNGGATDMNNLVAGTATTNSRMIPWEDKINAWTKHAKPGTPLSVRYLGERVSKTDMGKKIEILVAAEKGVDGLVEPVAKGSPMRVTFDPLNGTVFDKMSNKIGETTLVKESLDDSTKKSQSRKVRQFVYANMGKHKRFVITGPSVYKGYYASFKDFYREDEANVLVEAAMKTAIIPLWQLKPL